MGGGAGIGGLLPWRVAQEASTLEELYLGGLAKGTLPRRGPGMRAPCLEDV